MFNKELKQDVEKLKSRVGKRKSWTESDLFHRVRKIEKKLKALEEYLDVYYKGKREETETEPAHYEEGRAEREKDRLKEDYSTSTGQPIVGDGGHVIVYGSSAGRQNEETAETHHCSKCDRNFKTEKGLAIHNGHMHS